MSNLWEFLLQTLSVSLTAALLLLCKRIFADKLSARWQYGIWTLLALRILLPVGVKRYVILPLPLWLETMKAAAESHLTSAYTEAYVPLSLHHPLPVYSGLPVSVTDWLFVLYGAGVVFCLLRYLFSYIRLRIAVGHGRTLPAAQDEKLWSVCETYGLSRCRAVVVEGLPTAFICGVIRPVLVLPDGDVEEKILLHELLHLKYRDVWQNLFWCVLRCLHWCNPFLWYVCRRIENDMESLCDARVLERLEGEERRAYGGILLAMASEKYARVPGTTSISNGGKNIAGRIESLVRFRKYPRGMGLVSVCIALVLAIPTLAGTASSYSTDWHQPVTERELHRSMAMLRLYRCSTMAGALDTYAKGMMDSNGVCLAAVSPLDKQAEITVSLLEANRMPLYTTAPDPDLYWVNGGSGYMIFNLTETAAETYEAWVAFDVAYHLDENGEKMEDTDGIAGSASLLIRVKVWNQNGSWVVEETGERIYADCDYNQLGFPGSDVPASRAMQAEGKSGTVIVTELTEYTVDNAVTASSMGGLFSSTAFDSTPKPDAQFRYAKNHMGIEYDYRNNPTGDLPEAYVGMQNVILTGPEDVSLLPLQNDDNFMFDDEKYRSSSGSSTGGIGWSNSLIREDGKRYALTWGSSDYFYDITGPIAVDHGYAVMTFWDRQPMELFEIYENGFTVKEAAE